MCEPYSIARWSASSYMTALLVLTSDGYESWGTHTDRVRKWQSIDHDHIDQIILIVSNRMHAGRPISVHMGATNSIKPSRPRNHTLTPPACNEMNDFECFAGGCLVRQASSYKHRVKPSSVELHFNAFHDMARVHTKVRHIT